MSEALLIVQFLSAAASAGMTMLPLLTNVSDLIVKRRAEGGTITQADLNALFTEGDKKEAAARKQFADTLADPNTPKI